MLGTLFFLFGPILSRLLPALPPLAITGPADFHLFGTSVHIANGLAALLAMLLAQRAPKHARPWLIVAGLIVVQSAAFETLGRTERWESGFVAVGSLPTALLVSLGLAGAAAAIWAGWTALPAPASRRAAAA